MPRFSIRPLAAGLSAALLLAAAACSNQPGGVDDTVVVPEPGTTAVGSAPAPAGAPAEGGAAPAAPADVSAPAAGGAAVAAEGFGTLKGRVVFGGNPPERAVLVAKGDANAKDPAICATETIYSEALEVDPSTKGVKNALVYIPKPTRVSEEAKSEKMQAKVEFDQDKCVFEPHVLPMMKGATILVKSSDQVTHNVNTKLQNLKFNESISPNQSKEVKAEAVERAPGKVVCDIHPWMSAYWMVVDSPYFAVTDAQGNFEIKNVPAGAQKVVVWQEAAKFLTPTAGKEVVIKPDAEVEETYTVDPGKVQTAAN